MKRIEFFAAGSVGMIGLFGALALAEPVVRPPVVRHSAPRTALRERPLTLRAQVLPGAAEVRSVTLFGTSSRDVAPTPLRMTAAGAGAYVVTIPAEMIGEGEDFTYYIEALDDLETTGETPWFTVRLRAPPAPGDTVPLTDDPDGTVARTRGGWVTPAIIAGGATLVVGGVALATRDSDSSSRRVEPGVFHGSVTRVFRRNEVNSVESHGMTMEVTADRRVRSDNLHPDTRLEGALSGSTFALSVDVEVDGMTGRIRYIGSVVADQIAGSIEGEVSGAGGQSGTYSGSFTATRQ